MNGLLKLLWPNPDVHVPDEALAWAAELALELRRRVKEQQAFIGAAEFGNVALSYRISDQPERFVVCDETVRHRMRAPEDCAPITPPDSEVFPEPDPAEVKSSRRGKAADFTVGDVIDGRFEILEVLGHGRLLEGLPSARRG